MAARGKRTRARSARAGGNQAGIEKQKATRKIQRKAAGVDAVAKAANLRRLRRIEGQVRGLARMVKVDRYCPDILIQISSVQEALRAVGRALMQNHLRHCVAQAVRKGPKRERAAYDELVELIYKRLR